MKNYPILILLLLLKNTIFAHCQIPCGIYNDALRIVEMKEDFHTIKKSIIKIKELSKRTKINLQISKADLENKIQDENPIVSSITRQIFFRLDKSTKHVE